MMFKCRERQTVSRILAVATVAAWLVLAGVAQTPAFAANEKGPRCSDGIDNDGDSLIDCDDPDCKCGGDGDGGGGDDGGDQPCVIFDDLLGDSVQSDDGTPYCDNKKAKVSVKIGRGGHLRLGTNSSAKAGVGRGLFVDFGTAVTLAPGTANQMTIQTTDDALNDPRVLAVSAGVGVGAGQDDFDFFNMVQNPDSNVNLVIRVLFSFTDGSSDSLLIRLRPTPGSDLNPGGGRNCPSSDSVTVTDLGIDETGLHTWTVVTNPVVFGGCISRSGECEFGETDDTGETCLLSDVDPDGPDFGLDPGHIALSFGFTVTAAP